MVPNQTNISSPLHIERVFSPLLLNYYPPVNGVVLAYEDVKLSSKPPQITSSHKSHKSSRRRDDEANGEQDEEDVVLLTCVDEYAAPYVWATASLLIWRPAPNTYLSATLTHQSATHVTLAHLNTFAISILKESLPSDWTWNAAEANRKKKGWDGKIADEGGWWVDGEDEVVKKGKEFKVRVKEWDVRVGRGGGIYGLRGVY
ncbi:hypothetical protein N0V90_006795 [Kalmusia sp. IMI 367209]|nr:hypothetical protein N0V90_006795 [Kalmusia sp. IMI 367209]